MLDVAVFGLDLSLTGTALAVSSGRTWRIPPYRGGTELDRLRAITEAVSSAVTNPQEFYDTEPPSISLVVLEGPAFASTTGKIYERYGLSWLVRNALHEALVPVAVVPPATLKRFVTGKGNAHKDLVMIEVTKRWPVYNATDNNMADAVGLCELGMAYAGFESDVSLPKTNRDAIPRCDWTGWIASGIL